MAIRKTSQRKTQKALTAKNLQESLWEVHQALRAGETTPKIVNSMAKQVTEICRVQKLQLEAAKLSGKLTKTEAKKLLL